MKYWWLEKYKKIKIVELSELLNDINYFLVMPKNYLEILEEIKNKDVDSLFEEELLINLYYLVNSKNIKDNRLNLIINKLLLIPDTNLPLSDYSFKEILDEIKNLSLCLPLQEKLNSNNIGACYNCEQIFYLDKVKAINKKGFVLCPFCLKPTIYFDNDYIPMNYSFIKLASIYYGISILGCKFKNIQELLKKHVSITMTNMVTTTCFIDNKDIDNEYYISLDEFNNNRLDSLLEAKIIKNYYDTFIKIDSNMIDEVSIIVDFTRRIDELAFLIIISIIESISSTFYLKNIKIVCNDIKVYDVFNMYLKSLIKFK